MPMPKTDLGRKRAIILDASAVEFASMARDAGCRTMTVSRLRKIESGELAPRRDEKQVIADLLGLKTYEVFNA